MSIKPKKFNKDEWFGKLVRPKKDSHKGQNGRVLVVGGSSLFHVAPFWSANACSRIVDMVHFTSPYLLNNKLVEERIKSGFWNGIVVNWKDVEKYICEDDVILIGPGMMRSDGVGVENDKDNTREIVRDLLQKYPNKKWVVDGGALQEVELGWLNENMIITPNRKELDMLCGDGKPVLSKVTDLAKKTGATVLSKGMVDLVVGYSVSEKFFEVVRVDGGDSGMTKGGTGDVLAGIVAGLYALNDSMTSAVVASYINKKVGERLGRDQVFFNASDMIGLIDIDKR